MVSHDGVLVFKTLIQVSFVRKHRLRLSVVWATIIALTLAVVWSEEVKKFCLSPFLKASYLVVPLSFAHFVFSMFIFVTVVLAGT